MKQSTNSFRDEKIYQHSSAKKYIKFFLPGFAFRHDNSFESKNKNKFIGRELQLRRLYLWLTSDSRSGSYLITGYRGMGKSILVNRLLDGICRPQKAWKELAFYVAWLCILIASILLTVWPALEEGIKDFPYKFVPFWGILLGGIAVLFVSSLVVSHQINHILFFLRVRKWSWRRKFDKGLLAKHILHPYDRRDREIWRIPININLGQEVLNERDVLSLIAQNVRDVYRRYVKNRQNRPIRSFATVLVLSFVSCLMLQMLLQYVVGWNLVSDFVHSTNHQVEHVVVFAIVLFAVAGILFLFFRWVCTIGRNALPYFSTPYRSIKRLETLLDRINASIHEEENVSSKAQYNSLAFSFFKGRKKEYPIANVREIEQELQDIINRIGSKRDCPRSHRVQFIIIFDELDKVSPNYEVQTGRATKEAIETPEFDASVEGFSGSMGFEARKRDILHLLANMKLFIATVKAKCVFISGHELYDASLADLSDREFAISSIFNGVMNVDSFLTPEHDQNEVSSMTEMYVVNMLLPEGYLMEKMWENARKNNVLKEEFPSLRWYGEYLTDLMLHDAKDGKKDNGWVEEREEEIHFAVEFLRHFSIYLAHICNGSPKKISTYFEKYIRLNYDVLPLCDWGDILEFGKATEKKAKEQCVLWFDTQAQHLINFMFYIASPVMKTITNEVSHYGDKLLVTSSFILDQIYKYHGKGFSWRNLEQMPELLNTNKNPELRDSLASMMDFLLQTHITRVQSGMYQYKFHKQIAEEITYISMMSEEASAVFNFTLNESGTVKRYNLRLLDYYLRLSKMAPQVAHYHHVIERLHENLGDIYYMDEDYYCAIHEYRNALRYIASEDLSTNNVVGFLKCSLKIGMSYEYRRTYENAYLMYCQTINKLIHLRWIDEQSIGLDYTSERTYDWRIKQPMLLDYKALNGIMKPSESREITTYEGLKSEKYQEPNEEEMALGKNYRRQFLSGVWKDIEKWKDAEKNKEKPEYSTTTDRIISGLSSNFTPEKSDILQRLTVFEDVRYIYLAIIAKLFVIEKMEMGGVGYSIVEVAEAEFLYLHSATNMDGKFMISADFFHKMAQVMYYKNGYVTPLLDVGSLVSSLYFYDCNILGLIDDYCFFVCRGKSKEDNNPKNAVEIKKNIKESIEKISFEESRRQKGNDIKETIINLIENSDANWEAKEDTCGYLKYIDDILLKSIDNRVTKIAHCSLRRNNLLKMGYKLPCNACRYAYRSLTILMDHMFVEGNNVVFGGDKQLPMVIRVLALTSRKHVRHIRQMEMALLANTAEQMGDIMLSCSVTRTQEFDEMSRKQHKDLVSFDWNQDKHLQDDISADAIELLEFLTESSKSETERQEKLNEYRSSYFSKIDKSLLFYWAASRFYEIASLFKEASYCQERMLKVIQGYLKVIGASRESRDCCLEVVRKLCGGNMASIDTNGSIPPFKLVNNIFRYATKFVGQEFDNYELGEIHEYRWMFHMERMDDVNLTRLSEFTDVKPFLLVAMDIKLRAMEYLRRFENVTTHKELFLQKYRLYIKKTYSRICSPLRHDKTFKEEVLGCFMKAQVNKRILVDCLGSDIIMAEKKQQLSNDSKGTRTDFYEVFYDSLFKYLSQKNGGGKIDEMLFQVKDVKSRLSLVEYLVQDSFVCLSSILSVLTPHNHLTTFPNFFLAEVYDLMWEWSKYYEWLYDLYLYRKYDEKRDNVTKEAIKTMMTRNTSATMAKVDELMKNCLNLIKDQVAVRDEYGYQYTKMLMNIRHDVDDATIHHIFTNVSAQMSTNYYRMAKDVNNEGPAYKNMIEGMYVLDDDLRNDTCQSNLADERYLWHCGLIDRNRDMMAGMYKNTSTNRLGNYEYPPKKAIAETSKRLNDRLEDSLFLNSEY